MDNYLPKDPVMLLSYVNTKLRNSHESLEEFCLAFHISEQDLREKLAGIDYKYDVVSNQFK